MVTVAAMTVDVWEAWDNGEMFDERVWMGIFGELAGGGVVETQMGEKGGDVVDGVVAGVGVEDVVDEEGAVGGGLGMRGWAGDGVDKSGEWG